MCLLMCLLHSIRHLLRMAIQHPNFTNNAVFIQIFTLILHTKKDEKYEYPVIGNQEIYFTYF